jgi:hypothetical protein
MAAPTIINQGFVYRGGTRTNRSLTPRLHRDVSNIPGRAGLSAFRELDDASKPGNYVQKIDVARLAAPLAAILEDDGHVGIVPVKADGSIDEDLLMEWAMARDAGGQHPLTKIVYDAIVEPDIWRHL